MMPIKISRTVTDVLTSGMCSILQTVPQIQISRARDLPEPLSEVNSATKCGTDSGGVGHMTFDSHENP